MNYLTAVHTDVGIRKKTNQDSALVMEATTEGKCIIDCCL